ITHCRAPGVRDQRLDGTWARMRLMQNCERRSRSVRAKICIGESVFCVPAAIDLYLELEDRRVRCAPRYRFRLRNTCASQKRIAESREVISTGCVSKLVLVAKILIPVSVKEKLVGALARPPRFLEVPVQKSIPGHERSCDSRATELDLACRMPAVRQRHGRRD